MKVSVGNYAVKCPYCGNTDFAPSDGPLAEQQELVCAQCGGYASRKILLERVGDEAALDARRARDRLKKERSNR